MQFYYTFGMEEKFWVRDLTRRKFKVVIKQGKEKR